MPRKPLLRTSEFPYHVTSRINNRELFYVSKQKTWRIFSGRLIKISERYQAKVISFVLMSNHFHMLIHTPGENLGAIMNYCMRETSRAIGRESERINRIFGGRYKWSLVDNVFYLHHVYRYIYQNPLFTQMATAVEDYPYSSYWYLYRKESPPFPLADELAINWCPSIPVKMEERNLWLNKIYNEQQKDLIRRALRRSHFKFSQRKTDQSWIRSLS